MPEPESHFVFELFVADEAPRAHTISTALTRALDHAAPGRYRLIITNVIEAPERAETAHVIATPTLVRREPAPAVRVVGDIADAQHALRRLGIEGEAAP